MRTVLLRLTDVAVLLNVPKTTVASWVRRGYLRPVVVDEFGRKLYSVADVERLRIYRQVRMSERPCDEPHRAAARPASQRMAQEVSDEAHTG